MEWKVANGCDENEYGRVLKIPSPLGDHHASGVYPYILTLPVHGDMSPDVSSKNKLKDLVVKYIIGVREQCLIGFLNWSFGERFVEMFANCS